MTSPHRIIDDLSQMGNTHPGALPRLPETDGAKHAAEIKAPDDELEQLVPARCPLDQFITRRRRDAHPTLLIALGQDIERFSSRAAFANLCAAAQIEASS